MLHQHADALDNDEILILFPEGSRGDPEQISELKKGVFFMVDQREDTNVTPVMMHGLGRALPRGEGLLVPFNCDVVIGFYQILKQVPLYVCVSSFLKT